MTFRPRQLLCLALALLAIGFLAPTALAEDEEEGAQGVEEEIKQQMEKILKLMKENEAALLELSTGGAAKPKDVDVDVKPPPSDDGSAGGSSGSSGGSSGGSTGEGSSGTGTSGSGSGGSGTSGSGSGEPGGRGGEIRRRLEELMRSQSQGSGTIPSEIEKLLRMIPEGGQGQGQGEGEPKGRQDQPQGERNKDPETRDGRKQQDEQQEQQEQGEQEPEGGQERPRDPNDRTEGDRDPEDPAAEDPRDTDVPPWVAKLPPEFRDAMQGIAWEKIPPGYERLIQNYLRWLQKQSTEGGR